MFRLSLSSGFFPTHWKVADVVALHKKKSKSDPANYRPISLLAIVSKVFESLVVSPLNRFLTPLLNPKQFGFRSRHTSLDLLVDLSQRWANVLKDGGEVRAVALDISKAFDRIWHKGLVFKLERLGISGSLLRWLESFLSGRTQRVIVGSGASEFAPVTAGVPQGSVLAPILFLCFINDLFDVVENELDIFADDSTLWAPIPSRRDRVSVAASLNKDLEAISSWAKAWLVTYNHTKTELLTFSTKKDVSAFRRNWYSKDDHVLPSPTTNPHPALSFCDTVLPESSSFRAKIVGLTFKYDLTWRLHISNVVKSAKNSLYLLRRARRFLSSAALATIYKSHIRSRMEYLSPIWSGSLKPSCLPGTLGLNDELDLLQRRAERIIGLEPGVSLPFLAHRRGISGLSFMHRLLHRSAPSAVLDLSPSRAVLRRVTRAQTKAPIFLEPPSIDCTTPNYWSQSCVPLFTEVFNTLPPALQAITSLQKFKTMVNKQVDLTFHAHSV
jgi:hypothetical protein